MPLKLIPPRKGRSPYWTVRGTYLGQYLDRSTKARKRSVATKYLRQWEQEIERGELAQPGEPTFASAALGYMNAGGERTYLTPLLNHFKETPLKAIGQSEIDAAAALLYPSASNATRNRQVYTPVSAVMKRAGIEITVKRPKGADGRQLTGWLTPEEASRLFAAAGQFDREFQTLLILLCYTGMRLGEALALQCREIDLDDSFAYVRDSKNSEPRAVFLAPYVVAALVAHPRGMDRPDCPVFKFHKGGHLYSLLRAAAAKAQVTLPERQAFHVFSHTWATWMRRYAGLDTKGLVGTGRWKDQKSANRYTHVVVSEEAQRAALLPVPKTASR